MYFDKPAKDLTLEEAATIAAIIQTPARLSPFVNPRAHAGAAQQLRAAADGRRRLHHRGAGRRGREAAARAAAASRRRERSIAPYFVEEIRKMLEQKYGAKALYQSRPARADDARRRAAGGGQRAPSTAACGASTSAAAATASRRATSSPRATRSRRFTTDRWSQPILAGRHRPGGRHVRARPAARQRARPDRRSTRSSCRRPAFAWTRRTSAPRPVQGRRPDRGRGPHARGQAAQRRSLLEQPPRVEGALRGHRQPHRPDSRDGRRLQLRAQQVQPRDAGAPAGGLAVQADRLHGGDRSRLHAGLDLHRRAGRRTTPGPNQPPYPPLNYDRKFEGPVTLRRALEQSRNIPAVKAMAELGPTQVVAYAKRFGFDGRLPAVPVAGARRGGSDAGRDDERLLRVPQPGRPHGAVRRRDRSPIARATCSRRTGREPHEAIRADTAFVMTNLLRGVVQRGTARGRRGARLAARRQDRHDGRIHRCVVRRLRSEHHGRRVGGLRREEAARQRRDRRRGRAADLDGLHEGVHRRSAATARTRRSSKRRATSCS